MSLRSRIALLAVLLGSGVAVSPVPAQMTGPVLHDVPAGKPTIVESPEAMKVTTVVKCNCGGCVNQTIHECPCSFASQQRGEIAAALAAGSTPDQIIAGYVAQHGPQIRIVPERRGLDLVGFAIPFVATLAALAALAIVLIAWRRKEGGATLQTSPPIADADRPYLNRLERDLREKDR